MVRVKADTSWLKEDGSIDIAHWLELVAEKGYRNDIPRLKTACVLSQLAGTHHATETGMSCLELSLTMADILADLSVDVETLVAAIIFENVHYAELAIEDVTEQLGAPIAQLVKGIERMSALSSLQGMGRFTQSKQQLDNVRKMLLAMVDDPRVVLIKLAERLCILRSAQQLPPDLQQQIASEAMDIYAPLANRLGIGAVKWEMEDLAFRYLQPETYKAIAKGLKSKRLERDSYVEAIVHELNTHIAKLGFEHFSVYGRSKHIHSIYRKMSRKNVSLDEIYDATAVRVLVDTPEQCYEVLSLTHALWQQIPAEFDDYIINSKANGYQSLHTAVVGPEQRVFEVQIRTFDMHEFAEMGVAAHWKYKETGAQQKESHERKIAWLRDVLAWHKELAQDRGIAGEIETEFLEDRVYVFTPNGDILDMPHGVTPLDFAYHVHSRLGHRCRGAKVNGHIVPLTYTLKTGDRVEILTGKEERPSRDWINPHLHYLKTSRAKAKVLHWFKEQDYDVHRAQGYEILEKELKSLGLKADKLHDILEPLHYKKLDDLYVGVGRGDVKLSQIFNRLQPADVAAPMVTQTVLRAELVKPVGTNDLRIEGVGNLLTSMARCCQPLPGDEVLGYITIGRGVSIHRKDCKNVLHASERQKQRFLEVSWGNTTQDHYLVDLRVKAFDRPGLLKDITALLAHEKAHIYGLRSNIDKDDNTHQLDLTVEIDSLEGLSRLLNRLCQIPNVTEAKRYMH